MKAMKTVVAFLSLLVVTPIWFFLMFTILSAIHVDRLVWFLFWVYIPARFLLELLGAIILGGQKGGD